MTDQQRRPVVQEWQWLNAVVGSGHGELSAEVGAADASATMLKRSVSVFMRGSLRNKEDAWQ